MTKRETCIACWIPKATETHSECLVLLFHCISGFVSVHQCYVYTYIAHANAWSQNLYWLLTLSIGGIMSDGGNQTSRSNYKCT